MVIIGHRHCAASCRTSSRRRIRVCRILIGCCGRSSGAIRVIAVITATDLILGHLVKVGYDGVYVAAVYFDVFVGQQELYIVAGRRGRRIRLSSSRRRRRNIVVLVMFRVS